MRPKALEIFCSVGGMSLGLEAAGFDIVAGIEIDPVQAAVHKFNFPSSQTICADIREYQPDFNEEIDVIAFGSPCQSFSSAGLQDPNDSRSKLSFEALRIVLKVRPKYFVLENVPAMMHKKNVHILQDLIEQFEEGGYKIVRPIKTLNSQNFGVAQSRSRMFVLGYREDCPKPSYPEGSSTLARVNDVIMDLAVISPFVGKDEGIDKELLRNYGILSANQIRDRFEKCHIRQGQDRVWGHLGSKHSEAVKERFATTAQGKVEPISRFFKLAAEGVCNTIRAGTGNNRASHTAPRPIHYFHNRCLTIREAARLSGFPDWFQFSRSIWNGYRGIGNAVCPPVSKAIGEELINCLDASVFTINQLPKQDEKLVKFSNSKAAGYFSVNPLINGKREAISLKS